MEKSDYVGGSTALSGGGFWIPNSSLLRGAGAVDGPERAHQCLEHVTGGEVPVERWEPFLTHGPAAVEVLRRRTPSMIEGLHAPGNTAGNAFGRD